MEIRGYSNIWTAKGALAAYHKQHPNATKEDFDRDFGTAEVFGKNGCLLERAQDKDLHTDKFGHTNFIELPDGKYFITSRWNKGYYDKFKDKCEGLGYKLKQDKKYKKGTKGYYATSDEKENFIEAIKGIIEKGINVPKNYTEWGVPISINKWILIIVMIILLLIFLKCCCGIDTLSGCSCSHNDSEDLVADTATVAKEAVATIEPVQAVEPAPVEEAKDEEMITEEPKDECADTYGLIEGEGLRSLFAVNSAKISDGDIVALGCAAKYLNEHPEAVLRIEGHASVDGTKAINNALSKKRAKAVFDFLGAKGVNKKQMERKSYGAERQTGRGAEEDRRAEIKLKKRK